MADPEIPDLILDDGNDPILAASQVEREWESLQVSLAGYISASAPGVYFACTTVTTATVSSWTTVSSTPKKR